MENAKNPHILIVEDDADLRDSMSDFLRADGHRRRSCFQRRRRPRLIALQRIRSVDYGNEPSGHGWDAVIKEALAIYPEIVPIAIASNGTVENAVHAMKTGAYDYLSKPFQLSALGARSSRR